MPFPGSAVFPDTALVADSGHLVVGGVSAVSLAEEFGTPLYVFDESTIRSRCQTYVKEFTSRYPDTVVAYASKAYLNLSLVTVFVSEGLALDVVSGGELALGLAGGMPPHLIYFHGNNKSLDELRMAVEQGCGRIVVDNFYELQLLAGVAQSLGKKQDILLRLSPGVDPHTHHHTTTGTLDSKFGFPLETGQAADAVRRALASPYLNLLGLHFHLGSPIFETDPFEEAIRRTLVFAAELRGEGFNLKEFSPGGGFAIRYLRDQIPPSAADYAHSLTSTLRSTCQELGLPLPQLIIEPGRAITGPAGLALYRAGATKDIPNTRKYVSVDGGMGDNVRPALYGASYEAAIANRMASPPTELVTIAGKFCESGDILVYDSFLPAINPGDLIVIPASGAYCLSMASTYNLAPRPAIVMVSQGKARLIRRREKYEDLMALDIPWDAQG